MAYGVYNWIDKVRRYHKYSRKELQWLAASIVIMAVIVGFDDGRETFALVPWLGNFLLGLVAIAVAVFARESAKRVTGLEQGYRIEFKPVLYGLLGGLIVAFMSYGKIPLLAYSGMRMHTMEQHRLGYYRYQLGYFTQGKIALFGILANVFLAVLFKLLVFLPDAVTEKFVFVNVLFAITNVLPIPMLDGANLMYASRIIYAFTLGAVLALSALLLIPGIHVAIVIIGTLAFGILFWALLLRFLERPAGRGH